MRTLILRFYELFPDKFYKNIVIQLDPYDGKIKSPSPYFPDNPVASTGQSHLKTAIKRMWRIGRETEHNRLNADIVLKGNKYFSRAQATIRYDESDRSWHIHDGFLIRENDGDDVHWAYSAHGVFVNGHRLAMGEWEPITKAGTHINLGGFEDAKILVLTNIDDYVPEEDWTWGLEPTMTPELAEVDEELVEELQPQNEPWYALIIKESALWIRSPKSLWGGLYRLILVALIVALIIILTACTSV